MSESSVMETTTGDVAKWAVDALALDSTGIGWTLEVDPNRVTVRLRAKVARVSAEDLALGVDVALVLADITRAPEDRRQGTVARAIGRGLGQMDAAIERALKGSP